MQKEIQWLLATMWMISTGKWRPYIEDCGASLAQLLLYSNNIGVSMQQAMAGCAKLHFLKLSTQQKQQKNHWTPQFPVMPAYFLPNQPISTSIPICSNFQTHILLFLSK